MRRYLKPAYLRRRYLDYAVLHGVGVNFAGRRVCLFSHYDKDSHLDPYVIHYMRSLRDAGLSVVLISSNMDLSPAGVAVAKEICSAVILRENRGWDFAGWALGMRVLNGIYDAAEIVLANDSVYGPMHSLKDAFDFMNKRPFDIWGITQNFEVDWHLQSYFLVFKRSAITSPCFRKFWENVRVLQEKLDVIAHYETRLTKYFAAHGLTAAPYVYLLGEYSLKNPTLNHWRQAIEWGKSPFLKVQLLRENPHNVDISGWDKVVSSLGYDPSLIHAHLKRTMTAR